MTVAELIAILQELPASNLVCVQSAHNGFNACCSVVSEYGVTYVRDHVLTRTRETYTVNGQEYEIEQSMSVRNGKVLAWSASIKK